MPNAVYVIFTTQNPPPFRGEVGDIVRARIKEFNYVTHQFQVIEIEETTDADTGDTLYVYYGIVPATRQEALYGITHTLIPVKPQRPLEWLLERPGGICVDA